ncbi:helix-turn-helix transcriptional regulator [Hymenobacter sp. B81]|uniref:helix-turn-helix transcriptional regulator n=1 Tax=Hymenobacter sp. B81 TaxID=3344878 RepID=UPI0037DDD703
MNRLDRLTALLLQLQTRRSVRAGDLAKRYEVSARTIYRDLRTLEEAGVPLLGTPGVGFSLAEGYRLPPVMFSREEVTALITAEKLAEQFTDVPTAQRMRAAMDKVRAVLRHADRDYAQDLSPHIAVRHRGLEVAPGVGVGSEADVRQVLLGGVSSQQAVALDYRAGFGATPSQRVIEPIGLYFDLHWHVVAYCRLRRALRNFRLDRIADARLLSETFAPRPETLQSYWEQQQQFRHRVVLRFSAAGWPLVRDDKYYFGWVEEQARPEGVEMTLLLPALRPLAHWLLYFGAQVSVVEPAELRELVCDMAATAWRHHAGPTATGSGTDPNPAAHVA